MFSLSKSLSKLKTLSKSKAIDGTDGDDKKAAIKKKPKSKKKSPIDKNGQQTKAGKGVVMITNIPLGFFEKQMNEYFSQFGKVLRVRISKSPKTGKRRNYGFVEFEFEEVAKIAAQTMDNYLMFDHILKCKFISNKELKEKPNLFRHWNKEFVTSTQIHKSLHNKNKSIEREFKLTRNRLTRVHQMEDQLKECGIDFKCEIIDLPDISSLRQQRNAAEKEANKESNNVSNDKTVTKQKSVSKGKPINKQLKTAPKAKPIAKQLKPASKGKPIAKQIKSQTNGESIAKQLKSATNGEPIAKQTKQVVKDVKKPEKSERRVRKRVMFPKLLKYSLIRSANKKF